MEILHVINKTIVGELVVIPHLKFSLYTQYSGVKYLHILLSCVTCVHDDVNVYV